MSGKKDKSEVMQDNESVNRTKEEQVFLLDEEIQKREETITEFNTQLKALRVDLQEEDELVTKKVSEELDAFPESSPKGLLEKVYKLNLPKRGQLQESINKVTIALEHTRGKKNKLIREKAKLEEAIKEEGLNELTERSCKIFKETIDKYLEFENSFLTFKEKAAELGLLDRMFFNRIDTSKYPSFYVEVFGLTLMSPGSLQGLTAHHFITTAMDIGPEDGQDKNPLKARRFSREETKPVHRDITGKEVETPELTTDRSAEVRLGEIFEEGPRIPTY